MAWALVKACLSAARRSELSASDALRWRLRGCMRGVPKATRRPARSAANCSQRFVARRCALVVLALTRSISTFSCWRHFSRSANAERSTRAGDESPGGVIRGRHNLCGCQSLRRLRIERGTNFLSTLNVCWRGYGRKRSGISNGILGGMVGVSANGEVRETPHSLVHLVLHLGRDMRGQKVAQKLLDGRVNGPVNEDWKFDGDISDHLGDSRRKSIPLSRTLVVAGKVLETFFRWLGAAPGSLRRGADTEGRHLRKLEGPKKGFSI